MPSVLNLFLSFLRLGLTAFGGPAMVSYIKGLSVKKNKWIDEETFKDGVIIASPYQVQLPCKRQRMPGSGQKV